MSAGTEYDSLDGLGLAALITRGQASPGELLIEAASRFDALNPSLGAVVYDMRAEASRFIAEDLQLDAPLAGVPYLLKDIRASYSGTPTTAGSHFFADAIARHDSNLVSRCKQAGLVAFGKTNTPELGSNLATEPVAYGPTRNPWDPRLIPGGSSGGSAAAVAAGIVPWAHASDGGGSIRVPASCCGLFGLKPTRGRTPAGPDHGEGWAGYSVEHAVTRTVRDSAALLDATCGPDPGAPYAAGPPSRPYRDEVGREPGKLRIGYSTVTPSGRSVDSEHAEATERTAQLLESLGHSVSESAPAYDWEAMGPAYRTVVDVNLAYTVRERAAVVGREPGPGDLEPNTLARVSSGKAITGPEYVAAIAVGHRIGRQVARFFDMHDAFLTPTLTGPPPLIGTFDTRETDVDAFRAALGSFSPFAALANITGQPAMSVPLHESSASLPIGMHFLGAYGNEATLFRLAAQLESALPWINRRPTLHAANR